MKKYKCKVYTKWCRCNDEFYVELTKEEYDKYCIGTLSTQTEEELGQAALEQIGFEWDIEEVDV